MANAYYDAIGVAQDYARAHSAYGQGCAVGDGKACNNQGEMYRYGWGTQKNLTTALQKLEIGCRLGSGLSCTNAGNMHLNGFGPLKDLHKAHLFSWRGCEAGHARGCSQITQIFFQKIKTENYIDENDLYQARISAQRGCDGDDGYGCVLSGYFHDNGMGTPQDEKKAIELYKKACALKEDQGCERLRAMGIPTE